MKSNLGKLILVLTVVAAGMGAAAEASAGYWTTECNPYGCSSVYVPTCGINAFGYWVCG